MVFFKSNESGTNVYLQRIFDIEAEWRIYASVVIGSNNGLSPVRWHSIIRSNNGLSSIRPKEHISTRSRQIAVLVELISNALLTQIK